MITVWSSGKSEDYMPDEMLVSTLQEVRRHPWFAARAELVVEILRRHGVTPSTSAIEVGCGWGINLDALDRAGYSATGLDVSRRILELLDRPQRKLIEADLCRDVPPSAETHDALLALDVIEHLDDDRGAVRQFARLVRPGGLAVISVPALPELFSDFDRIQGHRRRYTPESLRAAFEDTGFKLEKVFWWGRWMVPLARWTRRSSEKPGARKKTYAEYLRTPLWPVPIFMRLAFAWEKNRALRGALQSGTSLFAVATRER